VLWRAGLRISEACSSIATLSFAVIMGARNPGLAVSGVGNGRHA
jgi:hypothetical protein